MRKIKRNLHCAGRSSYALSDVTERGGLVVRTAILNPTCVLDLLGENY
jgi:hypothetical protein